MATVNLPIITIFCSTNNYSADKVDYIIWKSLFWKMKQTSVLFVKELTNIVAARRPIVITTASAVRV